MADEIPHDGAPPEVSPVVPPVSEVEEPIADLGADLKAEYEPEPLPLRVRPFDPVGYHPQTHILPTSRGIRCFTEFAHGALEDLLLREPDSHLSAIAVEGESRAFRGYSATIARDWYDELPSGVRDIIDEAGFGLFCFGLTRVAASHPLLGTLVERWWDITNSFHFFTAGEIMMTP
ncbi:hypothetical protein ACSBR1_029996 [Camellia fascicularis]